METRAVEDKKEKVDNTLDLKEKKSATDDEDWSSIPAFLRRPKK